MPNERAKAANPDNPTGNPAYDEFYAFTPEEQADILKNDELVRQVVVEICLRTGTNLEAYTRRVQPLLNGMTAGQLIPSQSRIQGVSNTQDVNANQQQVANGWWNDIVTAINGNAAIKDAFLGMQQSQR